MPEELPSNVHVSRHPCVRAKLSQLRSQSTSSRDTNALVHDISTLIGCEALKDSLQITTSGTDKTPLGYEYPVETITPDRIALVPILRSGLAMLQCLNKKAIQSLLPSPVAIHHLGLFREPTTLDPVEYYNNLPFNASQTTATGTDSGTGTSTSETTGKNPAAASIAILLDPIVATGGTAGAAIQTLREWGVQKVLLLCVLGTRAGLARAAGEWSSDQDGEGGVQIWVGAVDEGLDDKGMIAPGLGDVGDRLFLAQGK